MISKIAMAASSAILIFSLISFMTSLLAGANIAIISPCQAQRQRQKPYANVKLRNISAQAMYYL